MAKTLTLKTNVHLSKQFGGIDHGQKPGLLKRGATVEIKSDELADHLVANGWADELKVAADKPEKADKK